MTGPNPLYRPLALVCGRTRTGRYARRVFGHLPGAPLDGLSRERAMREAREIAKAYSANPVFIGAAVLEVEVKSEVEV